ncbi:MAG: tetratricopeptide repeat protein, partial [Myxococcota bacterium]
MHVVKSTLHSLRVAAWVCALVALIQSTATSDPLSETRLVRDGRFGSVPAGAIESGPAGEFEIEERHGRRPGGQTGTNLFHSFSIFELAFGDTARFTASAPSTKNVVVAVPTTLMQLDGKTVVDIPGANLFLLSPQGILVGPEAQFDVPGALHLSTAASLSFSDGETTETFDVDPNGSVPTLAMAHPGAFGFLGNADQRIVFDSSLICGIGVDCGGPEVGGALSIQAGGVDLTGGTAIVLNDQSVEIVAEDSITLSGFDTDGDGGGSGIQVSNRSVQQGGSIELSASRIHLTDAAALSVENNSEEMTGGGNIRLTASQSILLDGSDENDVPLGPATLYKGITEVGRKDVTDLLQKGSVDILTLNANYEGSVFGGNITLEAPKVLLRDGAEVTSYAFGQRAGDITLLASQRLELSGRGGGPESGGSRVQSRNAGIRSEQDDEPSQLLIQAGEVTLSHGALLAVNTAGVADAGSIRIETSKLSLTGASQVKSDSTGTVDDFSNFPGEFVMGDAGDIFIAADRARLRGGSQISVFAQEAPPVPEGLGAGEPTPEGVVRGNIEIQANKLVLEGHSQIEASAGTGLGGSIQIGSKNSPAQAVVLRDGSHVLAQAQGDGETPTRGGDIEINAQAVFQCPDCLINADGPTAGTEGSVIINDPETAIESQVKPPPVAYMDASSLLLERCGARPGGAGAGRFAVARWPGLPLSPEGPLLALSAFGGSLGRAWGTPNAAPLETPVDRSYQVALRSAGDALRGGHSTRAGEEFARTERAAAAAGEWQAQGDALRGQAEALQASGDYADSVAPLEQALALARETGDRARQAAAMGTLGNAYVALGEFELAESMLTQAVSVARGGPGSGSDGQDENPPTAGDVPAALEVALLNNLGNERAIAGDPQGALAAYRESAQAAREDAQPLLAAQADANAARTALALGLDGEARRGLTRARASLEHANATAAEDTAVRIHVAHTEAALAAQDPTARREALLNAHADLIRASQAAEAAGDLRAASYALGNLGALYAQEGQRQKEALYLTRRAVRA